MRELQAKYMSNTMTAPVQTKQIFVFFRILSVTLLVSLPLYFLYAPVEGTSAISYGIAFWDAMLHVSILLIILLTIGIGFLFVIDGNSSSNSNYFFYEPVSSQTASWREVLRLLPRAEMCVVGIVLMITIAQLIQSQLQVVHPSWIWNLALWFPMAYQVYNPSNIQNSLQHLCLDQNNMSDLKHDPLCLSRADWNELR